MNGWVEKAKKLEDWEPMPECYRQAEDDPKTPWMVSCQRKEGGSQIRVLDMRREDPVAPLPLDIQPASEEEWEECRKKYGEGYLFNGSPTRFASGRFKYVSYDLPDDRDVPCIEDYGDKLAREHWKDYVMIRDKNGNVVREGPKPFRSRKERTEYERLTGLTHRDHGQRDHRKREDIELPGKK